MKSLVRFSILTMFLFSCIGTAAAFDLDTTADITIVEGVTVTETTALDFGEVADKDGTLVLNTDGTVTDANLISVPTGTPVAGVFSVASVAGAAVTAAFTDNSAIAGLAMATMVISQDGGNTDEAALNNIVLPLATSTWNMGLSLTVDAANLVVLGAQTLDFRLAVTLN